MDSSVSIFEDIEKSLQLTSLSWVDPLSYLTMPFDGMHYRRYHNSGDFHGNLILLTQRDLIY